MTSIKLKKIKTLKPQNKRKQNFNTHEKSEITNPPNSDTIHNPIPKDLTPLMLD